MWKLPSLIMREHPPSAGGKPTALNYFILSCRERQFWAGLRSHGKPGSVQRSPGHRPSTCCGSLHAPESRAATPGYCAARHFRSDWAIRTTFGLTDVGINRPFWPCSVLICYGTPEAAKHSHIAFAHLDYNGAV